MPSDAIPEVTEKILLSVWKLSGVEGRPVPEERLKAELGSESELSERLRRLESQGFITKSEGDGRSILTITPLGLSILRQLEEDKLQELR